jgi:hypothetical protein
MDKLQQFFGEMNEHLGAAGAEFEVGAEVDVGVRVDVGGEIPSLESYITIQVTEDGYETPRPDEQSERLARELRAHVQAHTPD